MNNENFELIVSIVDKGKSDLVLSGARAANARGGTIIHGRGTSKTENNSILGISIEPEKEIVLTLTKSDNKQALMQAICESAEMEKAGNGICFTLPINDVRGISSMSTKKHDN